MKYLIYLECKDPCIYILFIYISYLYKYTQYSTKQLKDCFFKVTTQIWWPSYDQNISLSICNTGTCTNLKTGWIVDHLQAFPESFFPQEQITQHAAQLIFLLLCSSWMFPNGGHGASFRCLSCLGIELKAEENKNKLVSHLWMTHVNKAALCPTV